MRKIKSSQYIAYSDLAWVDTIICNPEDYVQETEIFCKAIKENSEIPVDSLLHLGCGAGITDHTLKKHYRVTGIDISNDMLTQAKKLNPEINYIQGDMRTVDLKTKFDAVVIPDSIGYMNTVKDLQKAIITADRHLKPGGVLLIVASIAEKFSSNNFVYSAVKGEMEITIFENNYFPDSYRTTYEAILIYLIRRNGKLEIHTDRHILGLFKLKKWNDLLKQQGFIVKQMNVDHLYDRFMLENGIYPLTMFICIKSL